RRRARAAARARRRARPRRAAAAPALSRRRAATRRRPRASRVAAAAAAEAAAGAPSSAAATARRSSSCPSAWLSFWSRDVERLAASSLRGVGRRPRAFALHINGAKKEIHFKLVYYGPGLSGKTTNIQVIHKKAPDDRKGPLTAIATEGDRTLFFDYMPLELGFVNKMRTKFQLYSVPGQSYYDATRKLVLQGV